MRYLPGLNHTVGRGGADSRGKQAYVVMVHERHGAIDALNAAYGTAFDSWDSLAATENWRPETDMRNEAEKAYNMAVMRACGDQYYRVATEALRRYDTNHMFFGDKWQANGDSYHNLADITARYSDVAYFQCYGLWDYQKPRFDTWSERSGLLLLNGDSSYGAPKEHMPNPGGTRMRDEAGRAAATRGFCENAFARPDFVGWHICGILETWDTMPGQQPSRKTGLRSPTGEWCPEMEAAIQDISARLYQIALGEAPW